MLSRHVGAQMVKAKDWTLPFAGMKNILQKADITSGNLEAPFLDAGARVTEGLSFKVEPQAITGLVNAGFDIVSTANNHAYDRGLAGIDFTKTLLTSNGIASVGTATSSEGLRHAIIDVKDKKIGFLAYSYFGKDPYLHALDIDKMRADVTAIASTTNYIIVSMHAGEEYTLQPNKQQIAFAHAAIDAGADIVVGHHPHWVQPVEKYKGGIIFYSLGNFVFDQEWSQETKEGMLVRLSLGDEIKYELVPVIIENYCCPRVANDEEAAVILNRIGHE
jgi:poly-gamma-glutamate capsule biosynthesis protein CapA/YwtB (metallophosphatase superfamily)